MEIKAVSKIVLPESMKADLHNFCENIIELIKDDLGGIILYGGLAKDEFNEETSNINLLIVLRQVNVEILDIISPYLQKGIFKLSIAPFILTEEDILTSSNLFPIKFLDIKENHIVLWGNDYFSNIDIPHELLKRNCQRELKNLLLRLNHVYFQNYGFLENVGLRLKKMFSSFLIDLNTLIFIKTGKSFNSKQTILEASILELGLDESVMTKLMNYKKGNINLTNTEIKEVYNEFINLVRFSSNLAYNL